MEKQKNRQNSWLWCDGAALMFALVIVIIIATISFLYLSYFSINTTLIARESKKLRSSSYSYDGIKLLASNSVYGQQYSYFVGDDFKISLRKLRWGFYDLYYSIVIVAEDTTVARVAVIGLGKNTDDSLAIWLSNTNLPLHAHDSVTIVGKSIVPLGKIRKDGGRYINIQDRIYTSSDTLVPIMADSVMSWIDHFDGICEGNIVLSDSLQVSFFSPTKVIYADTAKVTGKLNGNIVIAANCIKVESTAILKDVILLGNIITIADSLKSNFQSFARKGIYVGKNCRLTYPTILALFADHKKLPAGIVPGIDIQDSLNLQGELYAVSSDKRYKKKVLLTIRNSIITGGIYSSGNIQFAGLCKGTITCEKFFSRINSFVEENYLKNVEVNIDSLPSYYSFSMFYPRQNSIKVVKWLQ